MTCKTTTIGRETLLSIAIIACCSSLAAALPPMPSMACPVIAAGDAPNLDGVIDELAWQKAEVQTVFHRYYGQLERPQEMRLITDGKWLYVALTAFETGIAEKDIESVSLFIAPHKASDQFVTFHATMNAGGITTSKPPLDDDFKAAFRQHADRWEIEIAVRTVPVFSSTPTKGHVFDFNLGRTRMEVVGDSFDIYQQWSSTGTSSGERYRFGEVTVGAAADRVPMIRAKLSSQLRIARAAAVDLSQASRRAFEQASADAEALLETSPAQGAITTAAVRAYEQQADALAHDLQYAVLVDRGAFVWACNPMAVPMPGDLPAADQQPAQRLDIHVLGGEWESAALVVTNLTERTLDGQVLLSDFASAGAEQRKLRPWDILQVRTAPVYHLLQAGRQKRDPLPRLQQGGLFRVAAQDNELLWLTFKSRDVPSGKYTATMTIRSLDDQLSHEVELVLHVYPLALGAPGRPRVNVWNPLIRGRDWAERAANMHDYYITCSLLANWDEVPVFTGDSEGNVVSDALDFTKFDPYAEQVMQTEADIYLVTIESHKHRFWPVLPEGQKWNKPGSAAPDIKRWSPKFNEIFARWVIAFRDHLEAKGLPPDRWAFYIMDEPWPGEELHDVIEFARQVKQADPHVQNYITLPIRHGHDEQYIEVSKHVDYLQLIGRPQPALLEEMRRNAREIWSYSINLRGENPFFAYRHNVCWQPMHRGEMGTGFWVWDNHSSGAFLWRDASPKAQPPGVRFSTLYNDHDNSIIPSLRSEAFREGIEDWKYLIMLDDALARAKAGGAPADVITAAAEFREGCFDRLEGPDTVYLLRDEARSHLLKLHVALGEVAPDEIAAVE